MINMGRRVWSHRWLGRVYRGMAARLAERLRAGDRRFRRLTIGGATVTLDVTEFTTQTWHFGGVLYEPATTAVLRERLVDRSVFVDVGANHGYFSVLAAAFVGASGRVVAFEPNPRVFDQLRTHVRINGFESRVSLHQIALGAASASSVPLFVSRRADNSGVASLRPAQELLELGWLSRGESVDVRVETLDGWLAASGLGRIDVLKLDVEGAEDDVLDGGRHALTDGSIRAVICETEWGSASHRLLCDAGYTPRLLDDMGARANILYSGTA
jgi:FkbM family methyltransferase